MGKLTQISGAPGGFPGVLVLGAWNNGLIDWEESIWCLLIHRRPAKDPLWQEHAPPPEDTTTLADLASYNN